MASSHPDNDHRVVPFRPRDAPRSGWRWPLPKLDRQPTPVASLEKFERAETKDDYRHRMTMNALGLLVTVLLVIAGIWIAERLADMVRTQDCFLRGQRNCAPIDLPRPDKG